MDKKYFVGRVEANQVVSAYVEKGEEAAKKRFLELINVDNSYPCEPLEWEKQFNLGCWDFESHSVVVREIDNYDTCPTVAADFLKTPKAKIIPNDFIDFNKCPVGKLPFFQINGQQQCFEIPGQTRSMIVHLTYGAREFSLVIDSGGIVLANGHLNGAEPRDPIQEQGFLWIDPFYLRENYDGEEAPTDEIQIHTYDYRPNSSDEPVFSGRINVETGAVEDTTEK